MAQGPPNPSNENQLRKRRLWYVTSKPSPIPGSFSQTAWRNLKSHPCSYVTSKPLSQPTLVQRRSEEENEKNLLLIQMESRKINIKKILY